MSWATDDKAADKAIEKVIEEAFIKDPAAFLSDGTKPELSAKLEPLYGYSTEVDGDCMG